MKPRCSIIAYLVYGWMVVRPWSYDDLVVPNGTFA